MPSSNSGGKLRDWNHFHFAYLRVEFWQNQTADLTIAVPVSQVYVVSSTFLKWIEVFGERSTIVGVNGQYTTSPCLNERFLSQQTIDFSAAKYNTSGFFLVLRRIPFLCCLALRSCFDSIWNPADLWCTTACRLLVGFEGLICLPSFLIIVSTSQRRNS